MKLWLIFGFLIVGTVTFPVQNDEESTSTSESSKATKAMQQDKHEGTSILPPSPQCEPGCIPCSNNPYDPRGINIPCMPMPRPRKDSFTLTTQIPPIICGKGCIPIPHATFFEARIPIQIFPIQGQFPYNYPFPSQ